MKQYKKDLLKFKVNDAQSFVRTFAWTFAIHQPHCFGVTYIIHVIIIKLTIW